MTLLDLLLPVRCLACGDRVVQGREGPVCPGCRLRMRRPPAPRCPRCDLPLGTRRRAVACAACIDWPEVLVAARCAAPFDGVCRRLLHALKYGGWASLAPVLGARVAALEVGRPHGLAASAVVPVPTTPRRRRRRGFNQAELLAREVAAARGIPLVHALRRAPSSGSQIGLPAARRRANVERQFLPADGSDRLAGSTHMILVDDVLTTGATAVAAARVLGALGARAVTLLALARSLPRDAGTPS